MTWIKAAETCRRESLDGPNDLSCRSRGAHPDLAYEGIVTMNASASNCIDAALGAAATTYRAFLVARSGRIVEMIPLRAASEDEARGLALELVGEEDVIELWSGLHAVARFERGAGSAQV